MCACETRAFREISSVLEHAPTITLPSLGGDAVSPSSTQRRRSRFSLGGFRFGRKSRASSRGSVKE